MQPSRTGWRLFLITLLVGLAYALPASATGFDCGRGRCGIQQDGSYPHLVIGSIRHIATEAEGRQIFRKARAQGYWSPLPADATRFAKTIRAVSILTQTPSGAVPVTMLMGEDEFRGAPLKVGDLVRYTPHDKAHERSPDDSPAGRAYWQLIGCVMVVCTAKDDACKSRYQAGVYQRATGNPLQLGSGLPWQGISPVDPISLLPKIPKSSSIKP